MSYDLKIVTKKDNKTISYKIKELQELKNILEIYKYDLLEVKLNKIGDDYGRIDREDTNIKRR